MVGMRDIIISNKERLYEISGKQAARKSQNDNNVGTQSQYDKVEISDKAKTAFQNQAVANYTSNTAQILGISDETNDPIEKLLEEYDITGATGRTDKTDDVDDKEAQRKMTAMKIAKRISNGDNVPMQDHRFLAEFDPNLYKTALKASMVADNNDSEDYDSLADELEAAESAKALRDTQNAELESYNNVAAPVETLIDSEV
jgi:hypothetical protein